jgi:hypothetical protein
VEPSRIMYFPYKYTLFTLWWITTLEWLCLVLLAISRRRVVNSRSRYGPFSRWRFYMVYVSDRLWFMWDRAGPIRGLWRLLDGKVESGLMSGSELRGGSPRPCRLRTDRLAPVDKFEMCSDACRILWGPVNLVASVTAWSNHNRYSMVVVGGRMR